MSQDIKAAKCLGGNIGRCRRARGLTQEALSARLQTRGCDISRGTLAKIEAGIRHVSVDELREIRKILGVRYEDLLDN